MRSSSSSKAAKSPDPTFSVTLKRGAAATEKATAVDETASKTNNERKSMIDNVSTACLVKTLRRAERLEIVG